MDKDEREKQNHKDDCGDTMSQVVMIETSLTFNIREWNDACSDTRINVFAM